MSIHHTLWRGRNASLDYIIFDQKKARGELVLYTSKDAEQGGRISDLEARALAAVLLEFARVRKIEEP